MCFNCKEKKYHSGPVIRAVRIFLLILIVIGLGLLATQNFWVPKLVDFILLQK